MLAALAAAIVLAARARLRVGAPLPVGALIWLKSANSIAVAHMLRHSAPAWSIAAGLALLVAHITSGALQHPDYLAYTNAFWWRHPEAVLADSDVCGCARI